MDPTASNFTKTVYHDTYAFVQNAKNSGHTVLITGASRGIGRSTAVSFAQNGAANIIIAAVSGPKPKILKLQLDVTSDSSVAAAAKAVKEKFGTIDVLINNAGFLTEWSSIADANPKNWWKSWEVNVKGIFLVSHYFIPLILAAPSESPKTIINISSVGALFVGLGGFAYQGSKTAVMRFTEFIAAEYAEQEISAYCVHPGGVKTELADNAPEFIAESLIDSPELAGDAMALLAAEKRQWLNGRYMSVNWDLEGLFSRREEIVSEDKLKLRMTQ
ncbi:putative oxidoreductase [Microthyrium microscopicum]|uniref:Putative oxidoreductase n=1 Tax=Microthyrium microscopicum TaxID=703497 RepID=A0A6A6U7G3_9PEZI|nr:putative oxidoreductase [Microthyrium microscopicum]